MILSFVDTLNTPHSLTTVTLKKRAKVDLAHLNLAILLFMPAHDLSSLPRWAPSLKRKWSEMWLEEENSKSKLVTTQKGHQYAS
jgi:hypothetical protein